MTLPATHKGSWYPTGRELSAMLKGAFESAAKLGAAGVTRAIVVPHAGYSYCVGTAAHAFINVNPDDYDRVIVLGPSHYIPISGCTIADATKAECPLGDIDFDTEAVNKLLTCPLIKKLDIRSAKQEHSLEMEFPLLRYVFGSKQFKIVPIMVGEISGDGAKVLAKALESVFDARSLLVVSSDFCHWGRQFQYTYLPPGDGPVFKRIAALDKEAADTIASGQASAFAAYLQRTDNTICGRNCILGMMELFPGKHMDFVHYSQSEELTDMRGTSVSYWAGVLKV